MLAAGTGLAPMLQVIKAIIDNEQDETAVKLFYTCERAKDILMRDLLDQYKQFWNFKVTFFLTKVLLWTFSTSFFLFFLIMIFTHTMKA